MASSNSSDQSEPSAVGRSVDLTQSNGRSIRVSLPTLGALSAITGVTLYLFGMVSGYQIFKSDIQNLTQQITYLRDGNSQNAERVNAMQRAAAEDRTRFADRLTALEIELKHVTQGIAELKLSTSVPRR
jgi:site-specific recombinase